MASGFKTSWLDESFRKIIINSLVALSFLGMGVMVPRFVTQITFEPVATMTLYYTQSITGEISEQADSHFDYEPIQLNPETGLFIPITIITSGLLVVCKNDNAHQKLAQQFLNKEVKKIYYAIVSGVIPHNMGVIDAPIGRALLYRQKMALK